MKSTKKSDVQIFTKTRTYSLFYADGWICNGKKVDPVALLEKVKNSFVRGTVRGKEYESYQEMYDALVEYVVTQNTKVAKHVAKTHEIVRKHSADVVVAASFLITKEAYSPELHAEIQKEFGCRFYDVEVAHPVSAEVQYRQGSSREELLYLLGVLRGFKREDVFSSMVNYVALIPEMNTDYIINIKDIVFCKLRCVHSLMQHVRVVKTETEIPLEDLISVRGYYLWVPEGYFYRGTLYGVEIDWKVFLSRKKR